MLIASRRFDCYYSVLVFIRLEIWNELKFIDRDSHWYTRRV